MGSLDPGVNTEGIEDAKSQRPTDASLPDLEVASHGYQVCSMLPGNRPQV